MISGGIICGSGSFWERVMATTDKKTIKIKQTGSPIRRRHDQRETLIGLRLNRIGRVSELVDTPSARGMIAKVAHLVTVIEEK
jgi:large subunit ribosomal protein L30